MGDGGHGGLRVETKDTRWPHDARRYTSSIVLLFFLCWEVSLDDTGGGAFQYFASMWCRRPIWYLAWRCRLKFGTSRWRCSHHCRTDNTSHSHTETRQTRTILPKTFDWSSASRRLDQTHGNKTINTSQIINDRIGERRNRARQDRLVQATKPSAEISIPEPPLFQNLTLHSRPNTSRSDGSTIQATNSGLEAHTGYSLSKPN
jgi:hypothetical protein